MNILKIFVLFIAGLCFSLLPGRLSADTKSPGPTGNDNRHNIVSVKELPDLVVSERDGTGEGVSAPFAGMLGDILVVAGGCNFPDKPAAGGGIKKYYGPRKQMGKSGKTSCASCLRGERHNSGRDCMCGR